MDGNRAEGLGIYTFLIALTSEPCQCFCILKNVKLSSREKTKTIKLNTNRIKLNCIKQDNQKERTFNLELCIPLGIYS